ncbi:hypothetical protein HYS11_00115 [Candidatus Gottesmanbacteria bacterium]|nr:hypothetical protein [Candidatus Gottesmanbacteria bacterium]MBI3443380.1 hypothetical protein [Candidatus Woesebacteria bacterium]
MVKLLGVLVIIFSIYIFLTSHALAATLFLKSVGGVTAKTGQTKYTTWVSSPTFVGTTLPNTIVNIVVDTVSASVTADGGGNWNYTPGYLSLGEHQASVASGKDSLAFTITIIVPPTLAPTSAQQPPKKLPVTADPTPLLVLILGGSSLVSLGLYFRKV